MSDVKRRRRDYDDGSEPESDASGLKKRYSKHARDIARYALLVQGTGRPLKKKEVIEALDLMPTQATIYFDEADRFLKEQFCLHLFSLKSVVPASDKTSPARDEYVVVSKALRNRSILTRMYPEHYRKDYGIMIFVIIMIVLKDDLVDFDEIYSGYTQSYLHLSDDVATRDTEEIDNEQELQIKEDLRRSMARLESMRAFKLETVHDVVTQEKVKKYRIGPYALAIINARTLLLLIMRLHFPEDKDILHLPEGLEKYKTAREIITQRISNCHFKEAL